MDKLIVTYALVRHCWHEKADHLDCFWPFVIRVMPTNGNAVDLSYVKDEVKADFELDIPLHSVRTILRRAEQKHFVDRTPARYPLMEKYALTRAGVDYLDDVELEAEVERRMNALHVDMKQFVDREIGHPVSEEDISTALLSIIRKNVEPLMEFLNPSIAQRRTITLAKPVRRVGQCLVTYMETAEREKPDHYRTLRDIILGSVLSTILNTEDESRLSEIKTKRFKGCKLFLDTNIVFSILGLHERQFNQAAGQLLELVKSHNFAVKVFGFTTNEICRVMNHYLTERNKYPSSMSVEDSIYSNLKRQGWTKKDVADFIISVEDKLLDKGIEVEWTPDIDIDGYRLADESLRIISQYKPGQPRSSQNHDLAAIETIRSLRGHPVRRIENSKVLFLTADIGLSRFNFYEMGHKANGTIGEVILDSLLTNIVWLRDPNAKVSLKSIIAAHSHGLFVKREIWLKFYYALKKLREEEKIDDQGISTLFYNNYIEDELIELDESQIDSIDEKFVLDRIEEASKVAKAEQETKEAEFVSNLTKALSETEQRKEQEFATKLETFRKNLQRVSSKTGNRLSIMISIISSLGVIAGCWFLYNKAELRWLLDVGIGAIALGLIWSILRRFCRKRIRSATYARKLREIGLENDTPTPNE